MSDLVQELLGLIAMDVGASAVRNTQIGNMSGTATTCGDPRPVRVDVVLCRPQARVDPLRSDPALAAEALAAQGRDGMRSFESELKWSVTGLCSKWLLAPDLANLARLLRSGLATSPMPLIPGRLFC